MTCQHPHPTEMPDDWQWCPDCGALSGLERVDPEPEQGLVTEHPPLRWVRRWQQPLTPQDEYHTMSEVYAYRRAYNALWLNDRCKAYFAFTGRTHPKIWRSRLHHDGTMFLGGYFVVGIELDRGQVTNHYKLEHWGSFDWVPVRERAPEYDGHTPADALARLLHEDTNR